MSSEDDWSRSQALELAHHSGYAPLDLSQGVAADAPPTIADPADVPSATAEYPPSAGSAELRSAITRYFQRRYQVTLPLDAVAACVGAKEFISTLPSFLRDATRSGNRDTVLVPALGYPPYVFGARLAGLRAYRVPTDRDFRMALDRLPSEVASRALCLWVNSPANPTGVVEPLDLIAGWGRRHSVPVLSDEVYVDLTWRHEPRTVLQSGLDGVIAVHSLAKRSNAPGLRVGLYAGDLDLLAGLIPRRRAAGLMAAAPMQVVAARLLDDDRHADQQRERSARRLSGLVGLLNEHGFSCAHPDGGLFAWFPAPGGDGPRFARLAALTAGVIVMPGSEYGPTGRGYVRIAAAHDPEVVAPRIALLAGIDASGLRQSTPTSSPSSPGA